MLIAQTAALGMAPAVEMISVLATPDLMATLPGLDMIVQREPAPSKKLDERNEGMKVCN